MKQMVNRPVSALPTGGHSGIHGATNNHAERIQFNRHSGGSLRAPLDPRIRYQTLGEERAHSHFSKCRW